MELSIFIDESGDFGEYSVHSPYYIVSLVFHNQNNKIDEQIQKLDEYYKNINFKSKWLHTAPLIRHEEEFMNIDIHERRRILNRFVAFTKKCNIKYECFYIEKKHIKDEVEATTKLTKQISSFIKNNIEYFNSYETIKIYYDNGQTEITKMISSIFNTLFSNIIFYKVIPSQYKLFQAADLFCYFKLLSLKIKNKNLSFNELRFFESIENIKKNYINHLKTLHFTNL